MSASLSTSIWSELSFTERTELLARPQLSQDPSITESASGIVAAVKEHGDTALRQFTLQFDGVDLDEFRVGAAEVDEAANSLSRTDIEAIDVAIGNIRRFHELQKPGSIDIETMPGVRCERWSHALDSVGLYVPAGTAPLPSAAIMLATPAVIAGCERIILCTPPKADGRPDAAVLVAAQRAGVSDIYSVGGAQAIGALAYGTESIPQVRKIFGPGNAWVTAAKALVSADPYGAAVDMPAGPSEVLVIADSSARADFVAADLLSQAEHGVDSQVLLICTDKAFATQVEASISAQLTGLSRATTATSALGHSRIIVVDTVSTAMTISNDYAPEHLILHLENAREVLPLIRNAGSVFVGQWSPESVGDYCSGTNHVLPTYGSASTYSGLGVEQFMRTMTVQEITPSGLKVLAPTVNRLARLEGLDAHSAAVNCRLDALP